MKRLLSVCALTTLLMPVWARAQAAPTISQRTAGLEKREGYFPLYWDSARGRLLVEVPRLNEEFLYFIGIAQGTGGAGGGSLDRGLTENSMVTQFERVGSRLNLVQKNIAFRAQTANRAIQAAVEEAFAPSILVSLPIEAEEGGRVLVDGSALFIRDATDQEGGFRRANQGTFRVDPNRSSFFIGRTKSFPRNTEVEVTLTYASDNAGPAISRVAADPRAITVRVHHSLVAPPEAGFRPRKADPRIGSSVIRFRDYATAYDQRIEVDYVRRWRLEKRDPSAAISEPRKPIVYHLDSGIPEPVRSAMRAGAMWWNQAFEAAGFRNAFQVLDPPPDFDPMDIRNSYIFWVNRADRGFSNGGHFADPRTGEILAGRPRLDSHRIRTIGSYWWGYHPATSNDFAAFEDGCDMMIEPFAELIETIAAQLGPMTNEQNVVLTRQALVTAHEVGHTLGLQHNWNSSMNNRASVMEYPTPRIKLRPDGSLDLSDAYQSAIGEYDKYAIRYGYTEFPAGQEDAELEAIIKEMQSKGLLFTPSTDPRWNWYDDGPDAAGYLREASATRRVMLERYGLDVLRAREPLSNLQDMRFWMVYMHHRWAIDAAVKYVGGMYHNFVLKGDTQTPTQIVEAARQREILNLLVEALSPQNLAIPERVLALLAPPRETETMNGAAGYAFDHLSAARTLAGQVAEQLLDPERAARLIAFADRQPNPLTLNEVIAALVRATWGAPRDSGAMNLSLRRVTQRAVLDGLMILGAHPRVTPEVRALVFQQLIALQTQIKPKTDSDPVTEAHFRQADRDIARYMENPQQWAPKSIGLPQPPGAPLGLR